MMTWENLDRSKGALWNPLETAQAYGAKMMEFGVANIGSTLNLMEKASKAKSPLDLADVVANHTRDQFEHMATQIQEMSELVRKTTKETEERVAEAAKRTVSRASEKVPGLGD